MHSELSNGQSVRWLVSNFLLQIVAHRHKGGSNMANDLDETTGPINNEGRDVNVISKQIPVQVGTGSLVFEIAIWTVGTIPGIISLASGALPKLESVGLLVAGVLPGLIFLFM